MDKKSKRTRGNRTIAGSNKSIHAKIIEETEITIGDFKQKGFVLSLELITPNESHDCKSEKCGGHIRVTAQKHEKKEYAEVNFNDIKLAKKLYAKLKKQNK